MVKPTDRKKKQSAVSIERTQLIGALDDADGNPLHLLMDEETGSLRVNMWVWDTRLLRPVKQPFMDMAALTAAIDALRIAVDALAAKIEAMP